MFSRKKDTKPDPKPTRPNDARSKQIPSIGLLDVGMPDFSNLEDDAMDEDFGDDEAELEAELSALQAGYDIRKVVARRPFNIDEKPAKTNARKHVSEFHSDDDDEEVDENDPELLAELNSMESDSTASVQALPPPRPPPRQPAPVRAVPPPARAAPPPARAAPPPSRAAPPSVGVAAPLVNPLPTRTVPTTASQPITQTRMPVVLPPIGSSAVPSNEGGSTVDVLHQRLQNYKIALENAKSTNDSAKVRRLTRGLKTLETMLKSARAGKSIAEDDIPPPVATGATLTEVLPKPEPNSLGGDGYAPPEFSKPLLPSLIAAAPPPLPPRVRQAPMPPSSVSPACIPVMDASQTQADPSRAATLSVLATRRDQYRQAAKNETRTDQIREFLKIAKKFDMVITAMEQGQEVDLKGMPPPPPMTHGKPVSAPAVIAPPKNVPTTVLPPKISPPKVVPPSEPSTGSFNRDQPIDLMAADVSSEVDDQSVFNAPPAATSILESLQQRLQKYKSSMEEATGSRNESKARRMGRIVKQYETAIKQHKAGKPVDFDELPTPPGFAPIPKTSAPNQPKPPAPSAPLSKPDALTPGPSKPVRGPATEQGVPKTPQPSPAPAQAPAVPSKPAKKSPQSLYEKQCVAIQERQKLFKVAALEAKKRGDVQAAKEYLRLAKGFEPMISASKCGFPVNMDSLPLPPQSTNEDSFEMVSAGDCDQIGDPDEMYVKLDKDLVAQIEMCARNKSHFSSLGDVNNTKKFDTMLLNTKKDLNFLRQSLKRRDPVPRFHYETRTFSIVMCCTDLGDDVLELGVIKGINYTCPNPTEIDTYVKFEFPFPSDVPPKDKTQIVKNTNNPEYNAVFKLAINRKSRNCTSLFKRKGIKLEVWSKGGFLRNDSLLGTAVVKLLPLETRCVLHDSFDLMEGRKPIGGKLEVKVRLRNPIVNKQVETHCEKWLVINAGQSAKTE